MSRAPCDAGPEEERLKMADPKLREKLADLVLQAKRKDAEAVEHLERALELLPGE